MQALISETVMNKTVRNIILGKDYFLPSYSQFKTVLLSGWYALFCIFACLFFLAIDIANETYATSPIFLITISASGLTILLHRQKKHELASLILFFTASITVYLIASSESSATGTSMFFLVIGLGAFTIFGITHKKWSYGFLVFIVTLFALANFTHVSLLPYRNYDGTDLAITLGANFFIALVAILMVALLLLSVNQYSERKVNQQNELLKKANTELDRFVYSASHDLRAPLSSVLGLIGLADQCSDVKDVQYYLGLMRGRIHTLENFIQDVTDFSRNSRLTVEKKHVALAPLVLDVWEGLRFVAGADAIRFKMDVDTNLTFYTDASRIRIVLGNLLSNAIRYHDFNHVAPYVSVSARYDQHALYLEVEDNGQGIAPEYQARIFEMFYRANENSKGSGLGLYIVSEVLAKIGGTISVESTLGKGSLFTVRIPVG